jgi:hypothetical protein
VLPHVLEGWLTLKLWWHHMGLLRVMGWRRTHIVVIVIIIIPFAVEIGWPFVFICSTILDNMLAKESRLIGRVFAHEVITLQNLPDIT